MILSLNRNVISSMKEIKISKTESEFTRLSKISLMIKSNNRISAQQNQQFEMKEGLRQDLLLTVFFGGKINKLIR